MEVAQYHSKVGHIPRKILRVYLMLYIDPLSMSIESMMPKCCPRILLESFKRRVEFGEHRFLCLNCTL